MNATLPPILTITDTAAKRVKALVEKSDTPVAGLRVGVATKGCSCLSYVFEYAAEKKGLEEDVNT